MSNDIIPAEFLGTPLSIIERDGQKWLTADQVGKCLGFAETNARKGVAKLYNAHADEFGPDDKADAELASPSGVQRTFIFSGTGCHLLGMFAQTPRAKDFRAWAKRVLMNTTQPAAPELAGELDKVVAERDALREALLAQNPQYRLICKYHGITGLTHVEKARLMGWKSSEAWRLSLIKLASLKLLDYKPGALNSSERMLARNQAQRDAKAAQHG